MNFVLNGFSVDVDVDGSELLLDLLRDKLHATGTKEACGEGECGACTVIVDDRTVNSCLMPAPDLHGRTVRTVEGLWEGAGLSPVQDAFVRHGAVQCGFCTPGMIMQATYTIERQPDMTDAEVRRSLEGNTCRCTGYSKIVAAVIDASRTAADEGDQT